MLYADVIRLLQQVNFQKIRKNSKNSSVELKNLHIF